jgi:hypothetical protein
MSADKSRLALGAFGVQRGAGWPPGMRLPPLLSRGPGCYDAAVMNGLLLRAGP